MPSSCNIALLTDSRYTASYASPDDDYFKNILREDALLQKALKAEGCSAVRLDWAAPDIDWAAFDCLVFRTTWDYYKRVPEFTAWLKEVESRVRLCNEPSIVRWNMDKHYLTDLEAQGVPVVPSRFLKKGSRDSLYSLLDECGWEEAILKPCISGGARHTFRINRANANDVQRMAAPLLQQEAFLLQPFMKDIVDTGEDTLMILDGCYTHAVRKKAKPGDFRVQDDHGGTVHICRPEPEQIALAKQAMAVCRPQPAYGRVDMVRDENGQWLVMELELIEPELWLRFHPPAAVPLARAIARNARGETSG